MKVIFTIAAFIFLGSATQAQGILNKMKKSLGKDSSKVENILNVGKGNSGLSKDEIISGLKEALTVGTNNSTSILNKTDGFFANAALKILMPEEAVKAEKTLRQFGMGNLVDKAILSMNRAAEDAAGEVSGIFITAIKGMTITDGLNILRGPDDAATQYLKKSTTVQLTEKMRPVVENSLAKVNATQYWKDVFTAYNKLSKTPVDTDLSSYVTQKSMAGIFYSIAEEEAKIRTNPTAQITPLLKKVFGK